MIMASDLGRVVLGYKKLYQCADDVPHDLNSPVQLLSSSQCAHRGPMFCSTPKAMV